MPYDVVDTAEARQLAAGNPWSFLHVVRPEIDLPAGTDPHAPEVHAQGAVRRDEDVKASGLEAEKPDREVLGARRDTREPVAPVHSGDRAAPRLPSGPGRRRRQDAGEGSRRPLSELR